VLRNHSEDDDYIQMALSQLPPELREDLLELKADGCDVASPEDMERFLDERPEVDVRLKGLLLAIAAALMVALEFRAAVRQARHHEQRYLSTNQLGALDAAVEAWRQILGHPQFLSSDVRFRLAIQDAAGVAFLRRYWRRSQADDLTQALHLFRAAVEGTEAHSPELPSRLNNLGNALRELYARTGRLEDLAEAIRRHEQAVRQMPSDSPERPGYLSHRLGDVLCVASIGTIEQAMHKPHGVCVVFIPTEQGQVTLQENL